MDNTKAILSTAYLPPIQYISKFLLYPEIIIEKHENYLKQTYRNRCVILGANGPLTLSIPVKKGVTRKTKIKDIQIDHDAGWQKIHFKSLESAYQSSPFYEYYIDDFLPFYSREYKYLWDYNMNILQVVLELTEIDSSLSYSSDFLQLQDPGFPDFRYTLHPKSGKNKYDETFIPYHYSQVFDEKFGFVPNLSIVDLLFNMGPESFNILLKSIKRRVADNRQPS